MEFLYSDYMNHYLLWASGNDHPGFVASIAKVLYTLECNLEDSSMMRLGSEFALFLIFTTSRKISEADFPSTDKKFDLKLGIKKISTKQARFKLVKATSYIVRVHGKDRRGIVFSVTDCLAKHAFNISDLSTHRTTKGKSPGYILLIEGELLNNKHFLKLKKDLKNLSNKLRTHISIEPLSHSSL